MKAELATSAGIILFCALLIQQALRLPPARFESLGPAFFPLLVCGLIVALSLLHMLKTLLSARQKARAADSKAATSGAARTPQLAQKQGELRPQLLITATVAIFIAYGVFLQYTELPYALLTFIFIAFCSWLLSGFRVKVLTISCCVAAGLTVFIYVTFGLVLGTIFP